MVRQAGERVKSYRPAWASKRSENTGSTDEAPPCTTALLMFFENSMLQITCPVQFRTSQRSHAR